MMPFRSLYQYQRLAWGIEKGRMMVSHLIGRFIFLVGIALPICIGCYQGFREKTPPVAVKGVLDLTDWDFSEDGPVSLTGEYEFYWKQHLEPSRFTDSLSPEKTGFIEVPGYWNDYKAGQEQLSGQGFATYRLRVLLGDTKNPLALQVYSMGTAFAVFLDAKKVVSVGLPGTSSETSAPRYFPQMRKVEIANAQFDILFHVSNFHHRRGGAWEAAKFGEERALRTLYMRNVSIDLVLFGAIFIMALYHIGLTLFRKRDRSPLYFGIFSLFIAMRLLTTGERYFVHLFPETPWEILVKLEYLSFYLSLTAFVFFMRSLFSEFSKVFQWVVGALGFAFSSIVLVTPVRIFSSSLPIFETITGATAVYGVFVLILALLRKRDGAVIFLIGFIILALSTVNDMLHVENIIRTDYIAPYGLFIFILSQAFLLSLRYSKLLKTVEMQWKDLRDTLQAYKTEISERKGAEDALRESEEKYRTILDGILQRKWGLRAGWCQLF
jgi:hypothetical protein